MKIVFLPFLFFFGLFQASAQLDSCLRFYYSKVTIDSSLNNSLGAGDFTIEATIKGSEANNPTHTILFSNRPSQYAGVLLGIHDLWGGSSSKMLLLQYNGTNYFLINNGAYNGGFLDDSYHHVAVAKKSDSLFFYIDGLYIGSRLISDGSTSINGTNFVIGFSTIDNTCFVGNISLVRLWNLARTPEEILDGKNNGVCASTSEGLLGYWPLSRTGTNTVSQVEEDLTGQHPGVWGNSLGIEPIGDPTIDSLCYSGIISPLPCYPAKVSSNLPEDNTLLFYPNPNQDGRFTLQVLEGGVFEVRVVDLLGRVVYQNKTLVGGQQIDLSDCSSGVYHAQLKTQGRVHSVRLVKE